MPISKQYDSLGVKATANGVPASVEEFDLNAKKVGACLDEAVNNVIYRSFLAGFRALFCEAVEDATSISRKTKKVKRGDKEVEVFDETEGEYIRGVRLSQGWTEDVSILQGIADKVCVNPDLVFDASATERIVQPKKLPEPYRQAGERIVNNGTTEKWAKQFNLALTDDRAKNIDLIGWAIKKCEDDKRKAAAVEYQ